MEIHWWCSSHVTWTYWRFTDDSPTNAYCIIVLTFSFIISPHDFSCIFSTQVGTLKGWYIYKDVRLRKRSIRRSEGYSSVNRIHRLSYDRHVSLSLSNFVKFSVKLSLFCECKLRIVRWTLLLLLSQTEPIILQVLNPIWPKLIK